MPFYFYKHPETDKIFEDFRMMKDSDKPFIAPDGTGCERVVDFGVTGIVKPDKEFWERWPDEVKRQKPKFIRSKDGRKIKYDPTRHC